MKERLSQENSARSRAKRFRNCWPKNGTFRVSCSTRIPFFSDIKVSSFYFHDTRTCEKYKITEGKSGWVMQGVVSKAAFRRQPRDGQQTFTVMSLHINNNYAKKHGIGKKLLLTIRAMGQQPSSDQCFEEASADTDFPTPPGPHTIVGSWCWFPVSGLTYAVSSYLQIHMIYGKYAYNGHLQFHERELPSCRYGSRITTEPRESHRVHLKERSCPYPPTKEKGRYDDGRDHSLSSLSSARELVLP